MVKVITYGTYDMLHYGHIRLLERARELGDYLIVGVTADDFDRARGKINVEQSLAERMEAVRATGLADEIIVEEYQGQKIDDIQRYGVDIFTVGSDWRGHFDYLNEYCKVVYLDRTEGISSSEIRSQRQALKMAFVGSGPVLNKYVRESSFVNGILEVGRLTASSVVDEKFILFDQLLDKANALFLATHPDGHYDEILHALKKGVHVLCESPIAKTEAQAKYLYQFARDHGLILMDAIKTAHAMAYSRLLLLVKSGLIGKVVSIDSNCSGMSGLSLDNDPGCADQGALDYWGPTAVLPIVQLLGGLPNDEHYVVIRDGEAGKLDVFVRGSFAFDNAVASFKVGRSVKTEGELVISGTKGYVYVPAPWWKTDYFEIRYESTDDNKRYFYQLDGEGVRNQLSVFTRSIDRGLKLQGVSESDSVAIVRMFERCADPTSSSCINLS